MIKQDKKPSIIGGIRLLAFGTIALNIGRLLLLLVLARLLSPSEFGILSLSTAVVGFSSFFVDAGVSNVFYQSDIKDEHARSALFWLNILLGLLLAAVIVICSPFIARFFNIPGLRTVLSFAAMSLLFTAMAAQHRVLLRRMMRFDVLMRIEWVAFAANASVTLAGALQGYGVYAMVCGSLMNSLIAALGYLWAGGRRFLPGWTFQFASMRPYLGFGLFQMGERLCNFMAERADVFIIGKLLGPGPLGLYDVMKQILSRPESLFNPIIAQATLPMMAKKKDNVLLVRRIYLRSLELSNTFNMAVLGFVFCAATPFLAVITGPKWLGETATFQWLAAYFILHATFNPVGALLLAKGRADLGFGWNLAMLLITPVVVWAGTQGGIMLTAQSLFLLFACLTIPAYYFLIRPLTNATPAEYAITFFRPLSVFGVCGLLAWPIAHSGVMQAFPTLLLCAIIYCCCAFFGVRRYQKSVYRLVMQLLFRRI